MKKEHHRQAYDWIAANNQLIVDLCEQVGGDVDELYGVVIDRLPLLCATWDEKTDFTTWVIKKLRIYLLQEARPQQREVPETYYTVEYKDEESPLEILPNYYRWLLIERYINESPITFIGELKGISIKRVKRDLKKAIELYKEAYDILRHA